MVTGEQGLPRAPLLSSLSLVVGNLLPIWAVWAGHMSVGDVFVRSGRCPRVNDFAATASARYTP